MSIYPNIADLGFKILKLQLTFVYVSYWFFPCLLSLFFENLSTKMLTINSQSQIPVYQDLRTFERGCSVVNLAIEKGKKANEAFGCILHLMETQKNAGLFEMLDWL